MEKEITLEDIMGAVARGWTTERNSSKVLDSDLAKDIAIEVKTLLDKNNQEEDTQ